MKELQKFSTRILRKESRIFFYKEIVATNYRKSTENLIYMRRKTTRKLNVHSGFLAIPIFVVRDFSFHLIVFAKFKRFKYLL